MDRLPTLLMIAWLLPLASFTVICIGYSIPQLLGLRVRYATQKIASFIAVGAIVAGFLISAYSLFAIWLPANPRKKANTTRQTARHSTRRANGTRSPSSAVSSSPSAITSIRSPSPCSAW
jgi:hypothetical protein